MPDTLPAPHIDAIGITLPYRPPDISGTITRLGRDVNRFLVTNVRALNRILAQLAAPAIAAANDPVHVAGVVAHYQVKAGLDPAFADPASRDRLCRVVLAGRDQTLLAHMTLTNRSTVAAGVLRGWLSRPEATTPHTEEAS